uniref:TonB-dependent receptor n=1 Tax=Escherichia coli TaxID=562 RepID=UPI001FCEF3C3
CLKTQPATGETYPKSDLFNKAWDTRLSWTPQFLKQQNLTISADILNVLDSKTAVDTTNTGVATYASGRTFWLDVSMKF